MSYMPPDQRFAVYRVKWVSFGPHDKGDVKENLVYSRDRALKQMCNLLINGRCAWIEKGDTDEFFDDDIPF